MYVLFWTKSHIHANKLRPTGLGIQATCKLVNKCFARNITRLIKVKKAATRNPGRHASWERLGKSRQVGGDAKSWPTRVMGAGLGKSRLGKSRQV